MTQESAQQTGRISIEHTVVAHNYAFDSENRVHADDVAARYGYKGGLVPGVGIYAYMTVPIVRTWGRDWLERGAMTGKFIKPVYHRETVRVRARPAESGHETIEIELVNDEGTVCAVGEARLPASPKVLDASKYPLQPLPSEDERLEPSVEALKKDTPIGSLESTIDLRSAEGEHGRFVDDVRDPLELYAGENAVCHPAWVLAEANELLKRNVALGPWIHTGSTVHHHALPRHNERVTLRGRIADAYERRGHECVVLDLGWFGQGDRPLAQVTHKAIVRPKPVG